MFRLKEPAIPNELLDQWLAVGAANVAFDRGALLGTLEKAFTERWIRTWPATTVRNLRNSYGCKVVTIYTGKQGLMFCETFITEER